MKIKGIRVRARFRVTGIDGAPKMLEGLLRVKGGEAE